MCRATISALLVGILVATVARADDAQDPYENELGKLIQLASAIEHASDDPGTPPPEIIPSQTVPIVRAPRTRHNVVFQTETLPEGSAPPAPVGEGAGEPVAPGEIDPDATVYEDGPYVSDGNFAGDMWGGFRACCNSGLILGVEGTFLTPINEPAQTVTLLDIVLNESYSRSQEESLAGGVRTWLGMQHPQGWGFRVMYWHFGHENFSPDPVIQHSAEPAFARSSFIEADTLDVELIQTQCYHGVYFDASFGARYASLQRNSTVVGYGDVNDVSLYGLAMGGNELEGTGFTASLGIRKPFMRWCNLSLYCNCRCSILWGDTTATVLTDAGAATKAPQGAANAFARDKAVAKADKENIFIAEARCGVQYQCPVPCMPCMFFCRAGFEYQHWKTGNAYAASNSFASLQGGGPPLFGGRVDSRAEAHDGDLDLIGFTVGTGLTY